MIHRAPFGSMERFCGLLIEHFAGAFRLGSLQSKFESFPSVTKVLITPLAFMPIACISVEISAG